MATVNLTVTEKRDSGASKNHIPFTPSKVIAVSFSGSYSITVSGDGSIFTDEDNNIEYFVEETKNEIVTLINEATSSSTVPTNTHPLYDAFGRYRVSNPYGLFASKQIHDKLPLFWDEELIGAGTSTYQTNEARTDLAVTSGSDAVIRQSRKRFNYQPGRSQRVLLTCTMSHETNVTKRIGYFHTNTSTPFNSNRDGIYLESDGTTYFVCVYKNGTQMVSVAQSGWNIDSLDGSGVSGITLDDTMSQIFYIDYEWLGVGGVRFGFIIDNRLYYVHHYKHANNVDGIYMSTPNQPVRYEIRSGGGAGTLKHICSAVDSEGGEEDTGLPRCVSTGAVHADLSSTTTIYPLLGVRLKSTHADQEIHFSNISSVSETNDDYRVLIIFNPTYTGGTPSWSALTNSATEGFTQTGAPAITIADGAWELNMREIFTHSSQSIGEHLESNIRLGAKIDGTMDEVVIAVMPLSANADINIALNWIEL